MKRHAVGLLVLLAGCAGPRPVVPGVASVTAPAAWRTDPSPGPGPGVTIGADWWQAFGDPVLTRLIDRALAGNTNLATASERIAEARGQARLAHAALLPDIEGSVAGGPARTLSAFGTGEYALSVEPQLSVSYELDLFGRLRNASAAARAQLLATAAARDTVRLGVIAETVRGYIGLRLLDAQLDTVRATLVARAESLRIARRQTDSGYAATLPLRQAEAEYHAAEQLVPQTERAIAAQENGLSLLLGDNPHAIERGLPLDRLAIPAVPAGLPADLLRRRPDIYSAEQQLVAADRSLDSARAAFLPSIQLSGSAGLVLADVLPNPVTLWSLGGSILAPIFDGGRNAAGQDIAAARRNEAAFAYRAAALTAFREVDDGFDSIDRLAKQEVALTGQRDALAKALVLATNRYRAGYSPYLEQLDAERGLLSAELALIQMRGSRLSAYVTLYQAMGGGWVQPGNDAAH